MGHIVKMGQTEENGSHFEKWVTLNNLSYLDKRVHCEKWVTTGKMAHAVEMGHIWENGVTLKNVSHLEKWVTFEKKWVTP